MREEVLKVLNEVLPQIDFTESEHMVDEKILDSLSIVTLISELSISFDVIFDLSEIDMKQFNSLDSIVDLVSELKGK